MVKKTRGGNDANEIDKSAARYRTGHEVSLSVRPDSAVVQGNFGGIRNEPAIGRKAGKLGGRRWHDSALQDGVDATGKCRNCAKSSLLLIASTLCPVSSSTVAINTSSRPRALNSSPSPLARPVPVSEQANAWQRVFCRVRFQASLPQTG